MASRENIFIFFGKRLGHNLHLNLEVGGVTADLRAGVGLHARVEQNVGDDEEHNSMNAESEQCGPTAFAGDEVRRLEDALSQAVHQAEGPWIEDRHSEYGSQQRRAAGDLALLLAIVQVTLGKRHLLTGSFRRLCSLALTNIFFPLQRVISE